MRIWRWQLTWQFGVVLLALVAIISGVITFSRRPAVAGFILTSPAFKNGDALPPSATCDGTDINPAFEFGNIPTQAKSLAILGEKTTLSASERKLPNSNLWLVFNIPTNTKKIVEGIRPPGTITRDYKGNFSYNGPCPAKGKTDQVIFHLYALNIAILPINSSASQAEFEKAIKGHIMAETSLTATYKK